MEWTNRRRRNEWLEKREAQAKAAPMNEQERKAYDERWHMAQDLLAVMVYAGDREATHARAIDLLDGVDWDYETAVALVSAPAPSDGPGSGAPGYGCC